MAERLDKALSEINFASRKEIKEMVHHKRVSVNDTIVRDPSFKVEKTDIVKVNGEQVELFHKVAIMLHKPAGYVTSTEDPRDLTVMSLIPKRYIDLGVVPAGRLDKDTEGLLILTNDGNLIHRLISPKSGIKKKYYAEIEGVASEEDIKAFKEGITLKDGSLCLPAELELLDCGKCNITISEGMYHQVKRMMASRGLKVTYLKRTQEGPYELGNLPKGEIIEVGLFI